MARSTKQHRSTAAVTRGSAVRFQSPASSRHHSSKGMVSPDLHPVSGFVDFLREHAIVGLAIGFVIGTQVQSLVKQLVSSFIDPLFKLLFGQALSQRATTLHWHGRAASFGWGSFAYGLLDFIFVLAVLYVIVKSLSLDQLDRPKKKSKQESDLEIEE